MSAFHCSCGFGTNEAESFGDHLGLVFDRYDDLGTDGNRHAEVFRDGLPGHLCMCGYASADSRDFNDHLLISVMTADGVGIDGARHVPVDTATPDGWHVT